MLVAICGTICLLFSLQKLTIMERFNSFKKVPILGISVASHYCQHQTGSTLPSRAFCSTSRSANSRFPKAEGGREEADLSDGKYSGNYQIPQPRRIYSNRHPGGSDDVAALLAAADHLSTTIADQV